MLGADNRKRHPLYHVWRGMRMRCQSPNATSYELYGGRGITICPEWDDFWTFAFDMGDRPPGTTLDRKDNDGPYSPENCRWASAYEQQRNGANAVFLTHNGETLCVTDWSKRFGITQSAISHRIRERGIEHCLDGLQP